MTISSKISLGAGLSTFQTQEVTHQNSVRGYWIGELLP